MVEIIGWWEFALAAGVVLLAIAEVVGLMAARRAGLTRNVSRLVTHGFLAALSALYAVIAVWWSGSLGETTGLTGAQLGISNWGFLVLAGMLGLVVYELVAQIWAMQLGLTRSVPRLVSRVATATIVILMFMMNLTRWQIYRQGVLESAGAEAGAGSGLLQMVGWWELVLVVGVALLALAELFSLVAARRAGKTRNVSRLLVYGLLAAFALVYALIAVSWSRGLGEAGPGIAGAGPEIAQWGLVALTAILFLTLFSLATVLWARQFGQLTETPPRLVVNLALAAFVVLVVAINLTRWQLYFGILEDSYQESIPSSVDAG